jgi:tRNA threonylcarbamoyladenosine biosynthesis protein TsaB
MSLLVCSIDTSGRNGSVALARYGATVVPGAPIDAEQMEVLEFASLQGGDYAERLLPTLASGLEKRGFTKKDIGLFAVASGPGSFTGLRVGLSTVKALGDALQVPIVAVGVLEVVALAATREGRVIAALDAQRNEVYAGEYTVSREFGPFPLHAEYEALSSVDDFCTWLSARVPVPVTFTPDATIAERVRKAGSPAEEISRPAADSYARVGLMKLAAGQTISAETLDANYIRRSDAEILVFTNPARAIVK